MPIARAERVLGDHALYCVLDNALGMLLHGLLEGFALQAAGITAVTIVFLAGSLNARDLDLVSVDDYDEVARCQREAYRWACAYP